MDYRLIRASYRLSETPICALIDGYGIDVFWFRAMIKEGNWLIRRHAHSTYEFHFCRKGECRVETDAASFLIKEGQFYLSGPGVYHAQFSNNQDEFIEFSLNCNIRKTAAPKTQAGKEAEKIISLFNELPCLPVADHFNILSLFEESLEEAERQQSGYIWKLQSKLAEILIAAARSMERDHKSVSVKNISINEPNYRMTKIEEFIEANISKNIRPSDIAERLNLSEKQISRIVYAYKGFPTKKFITRTKLHRAKELLVSSDISIKEIAGQLGFSDEYYFSAVFKIHEGIPPGVFRTSMKIPEKPHIDV